MSDLSKAFADIATRMENAHTNFAEGLMEIAGLDAATARKVTSFYLKKKLAKMDAVIGRISVKHGGYLDKQAILRAAELAA